MIEANRSVSDSITHCYVSLLYINVCQVGGINPFIPARCYHGCYREKLVGLCGFPDTPCGCARIRFITISRIVTSMTASEPYIDREVMWTVSLNVSQLQF